MSNEPTMQDKIERFVKGKMSEEESLAFKNTMKEDAILEQSVAKESVINLLVVENGLSDIKDLFKNDPRFTKAKPVAKTNTKGLIGGSLAIVACLAVGGYLFFNNETKPAAAIPQTQTKETEKVVSGKEISAQVVKTANGRIETKKAGYAAKVVKNEVFETEVQASPVAQKEVVAEVVQSNKLETWHKQAEVLVEKVDFQKDSCVDFKPIVQFVTKPSLLNGANGSIKCLSNESGLKFKLLNAGFSDRGVFEQLKAGSYTVLVENDNKCTWQKNNVLVSSTFCVDNVNLTFNSSQEANVEIPILVGQQADVVLYNKQMVQIANFQNVSELIWEGRNQAGSLVETGLYKVEIKYKSGEFCFLNLTVFK